MSKFERIVPDKRCANFLPAVEKERQQCARVARRMRTPEGFRSPVGGINRPFKRPARQQWGREHLMQDDEVLKLERALTEVYRSQSEASSGSVEVTQEVMRQIRQLTSSKNSVWAQSSVLDQLVWRTAAITAAVVMIVTILTVETLRTTADESGVLLADEFESAPLFGD